ncbi:hypothetical protein BQ8482_150109 [Mesorhizobium delmotii]|uniref:Uncharacterized protein n=1 Tax=Mesorhizobium delmotii TaxID=1631247 RepID=A0A2P9AHA5_9HYPH|nr:hypothetical protein BQ8482_150109 [Mesorhizobium delmotii]
MMLPRWPEIYHDRRAPDSNTPQFMSSLSEQTHPQGGLANVGSQRFPDPQDRETEPQPWVMGVNSRKR